MTTTTKVWLVIAVALIIAGAIIFAGLMAKNNFNFSALDSSVYVTNTYDITDDFNEISITADTADIDFKQALDGKTRVVCFEKQGEPHTVNTENGALIITHNKPQSLKDSITFLSINQPKITVYLTKQAYGELVIKATTSDINLPKSFSFESITVNNTTGDFECEASVAEFIDVKVTTGDVSLEDVTAKSINVTITTGHTEIKNLRCENDITITATTGRTELSDVKCKNLNSVATTGKITLDKVIASEKLTIERDTGDINFEESDATEIFAKATTGDIRGSLLSPKTFTTNTNTGSIRVPSSVTGGKCELKTTTGDIKIIVL